MQELVQSRMLGTQVTINGHLLTWPNGDPVLYDQIPSNSEIHYRPLGRYYILEWMEVIECR